MLSAAAKLSVHWKGIYLWINHWLVTSRPLSSWQTEKSELKLLYQKKKMKPDCTPVCVTQCKKNDQISKIKSYSSMKTFWAAQSKCKQYLMRIIIYGEIKKQYCTKSKLFLIIITSVLLCRFGLGPPGLEHIVDRNIYIPYEWHPCKGIAFAQKHLQLCFYQPWIWSNICDIP